MAPVLRWLAAAAIASAAVLYLAAQYRHSDPHPSVARVTERDHIQTHLMTVESALRARDVSGLDAQQRSARTQHLDALQSYWEAGRFPHNHDFPSEAVPYFVDEHGTLCAMAYLIAQSGRADLVEIVSRISNNATVFEIAADPRLGTALEAWLDTAGLTVDEAQAIQPAYCYVEDELECSDRTVRAEDQITTRYAAASAMSGGASAIALAFNMALVRSGGSTLTGALGVASGTIGMALGTSKLDESDGPLALGVVNVGVGAVSLILGLHTLLDQEPEALVARSEGRMQPLVSVGAGGETTLGINIGF